ncbi:MAG: hypothetical protein M3Q47_16725, partial [Actinomycetota bacterium]|nr:hypothetical protein [Actinomycetota bacterium]
MTVVETILVYAVAPLAVVAVLALLTLVPGRPKKARYKPGQPWEHEPVWYEPHPVGGGGHSGPTAAHGPAGVPGDGTTALGSSMYPEQHGERNTGQPGAPTAPHVGGDGARGTHGAHALG